MITDVSEEDILPYTSGALFSNKDHVQYCALEGAASAAFKNAETATIATVNEFWNQFRRARAALGWGK